MLSLHCTPTLGIFQISGFVKQSDSKVQKKKKKNTAKPHVRTISFWDPDFIRPIYVSPHARLMSAPFFVVVLESDLQSNTLNIKQVYRNIEFGCLKHADALRQQFAE